MTGGGALAQLYTETGLFVLVFAREWIQEGTPLLKQALILKRTAFLRETPLAVTGDSGRR